MHVIRILCRAVALAAFVAMPSCGDQAKFVRTSTTVRSTGPLGLERLDKDGAPQLPDDYTGPDWVQIGTWAIAPSQGKDVSEQHLVYTERAAFEGYRKTGKWPDGSTILKELRAAKPQQMSTGHSAPASKLTGWFVMVKHDEKPTRDTPHWGDGWYGAQYGADAPDKNVSPGWISCKGCHIPAQGTDWVFVQGYPRLRP